MIVIEKFVERVAGGLLALITMIYASGFIIVNSYLSHYHVVQVEMFQPSFISAGMFYVLMTGFITLLAWPIARAITEVFTYFDTYFYLNRTSERNASHQEQSSNAREGVVTNQLSIQTTILRNIGLASIAILSIAVLVYLAYLVDAIGAKSLIIRIIGWASVTIDDENLKTINSTLKDIAMLLGFLSILLFLIVQNYQRCSRFTRDFAIAITVVSFLLVHSYSLLTFADRVYGFLPSNIGGGHPVYIRFYVSPAVASQLDALDDNFINNNDAIISNSSCDEEKYRETNSCVLVTNTLTLFWQIKSVDLRGNEDAEIYFVRPYTCESCPVIKIYSSSIFSVVYVDLSEDQSP